MKVFRGWQKATVGIPGRGAGGVTFGRIVIDGKARRRELAVVGSVLVIVHLLFWWQGQPLAHWDLSGYAEQAMLLATRP